MAQGTLKVGERITERVIDGMHPMLVEVVSEPVITPCCEKHCACHGDGTFFCCRCGVELKIVD